MVSEYVMRKDAEFLMKFSIVLTKIELNIKMQSIENQ